jgi:hypothetical protein
MNAESFNRLIGPLPLQERARALNHVAFHLTIRTRLYYGGSSRETEALVPYSKQLVGINELQHKLSAQVGHYLDGEEEKVYPLDVFSRILFEVADHYGLTSDLAAAVKYVEERITKGAAGRGRP